MARFENFAPVRQQVGQQVIHGDVYNITDLDASIKRQNSDLVAINIREHISNTLQSNYEDVALSVTEDAYEGTCSWLLTHRIYSQWSANVNPDLLWLCGPPGCGKTIVSRFVLRHWKKVWTESHNVVYFFFSGQVEKAASPINFLSALIHQILQQYPITDLLLRELPALRSPQSVATLTSSEEGLWSTLNQILGALHFLSTTNPQKPLLCVIDALEECSDSPSRHFHQRLLKDLCASQVSIRVLATCRQDYLERSHDILPRQNVIYLHEENLLDIHNYVASHLKLWSHSPADSEVVKKLELTITSLANGIFLWAALVVEGLLLRGSRLQTVLDTIKSFPRGRDDKLRKLYEEILKQASNNLQDDYLISDIKSILRAVILSARPLNINELAECLESESKDDRRLDLAHDIKSTCRGLLRIEGNHVRPFHITLAAYIGNAAECLPQFYIDPDEGHAQLAEICLSYAIDPISFAVSDKADDIEAALAEHAFLDYAASQWPYHVKRTVSRRQSTKELMHDLLGTEQNFRKWYSIIVSLESVLRQQLHLFRMAGGQLVELLALQPSPAHILSLIGFDRPLFISLFENDELETFSLQALSPDNKDGQGRTPAHWAACYATLSSTFESFQWMTMLITNSVKAESLLGEPEVLAYILSMFPESAHVQDVAGKTPLHLACALGDPFKAKVLLNVKPDINIRDSGGYTALHHCCGPMGFDVARLIVTNNADLEVRGDDGNTALHIAALHGQERIVKLLVEKKADVNAQNVLGMTPLHFVVHHGKSYAQLLIANMVKNELLGGQTDGDAMDWLTSFFESFAARELTIKRLIAGGADLERKTKFGETALFIAAFGGHLQFVKLLIAAKADISATNAYGWTSLYAAAFMGHELIVQLLVDAGAETTRGDVDGTTPLHIAARIGHASTVKVLIRTGIDVNTPNSSGHTPLHQALMTNVDVLKFIATSMANANTEGTPYLAALEDRPPSVRLKAHEDIVSSLLEAGADINAVAVDGTTPLHVAAVHGHAPLLDMIMEKGAKFDTINVKGGRPVDAAAMMGNDECVQVLLKRGVQLVTAGSSPEGQALHFASMMGHESTVAILLQAGAEVNGTSPDGSTAIHFVVENDESEFVSSLTMEPDAQGIARANEGLVAVFMAQRNRSWDVIEEGRLRCLQLLISNGADVNSAAKDGMTALHKASIRGREPMVETLLDNGGSIDLRSENGATALWYALLAGLPAMVRGLIKRGADVEAMHNGFPPLLCALFFEHFEVARVLIESGADTNRVFEEGLTCLLYTAETGQVEMTKALLEHGANARAVNEAGDSALNFAAEGGHIDIVKLLLEHDVDVNVEGAIYTPLQGAAQHGYMEVVEALLERGASVSLNKKDTWSPLQLAARYDHRNVLKVLLEKGADMSAADSHGWTSLHLAASTGNDIVVKELLEYGADRRATTVTGCTPLYLAASNNHIEVVCLLVDKGADISTVTEGGWTSVHAAASNGHATVVEKLLEHGADINIATDTGRTPLYSASSNNHIQIVRLLIQKGADVNAKTDQGWTPLHSAADQGHTAIVVELLKNGADQSVTSSDGRIPLHRAISNDGTETLSALLDLAPDPNAMDNRKWRPLHIAADRGNLGATRLLLEAGADPNARSFRGSTPVHSAAQSGNLELLQLIVTYKGSLDSKNDGKQTVLHVAASNGHTEMCKWLLLNGADIDAVNEDGCTPLLEALRMNHHDIARQFLDANADIGIIDLQGFTAQHYAAQINQVEFLKLLEAKGASLNVAAHNGSTLLHIAAISDCCEFLEFLLQERQQNPNVYRLSRISPLHDAIYASRLRAIKILVEAGADIGYIDCFGRSCLDWARSYPAMLTIVSKGVTEQKDVTAESSHQVILTSISELLSAEDKGHEVSFHLLGHCFLYLSEDDNARMAFSQQIIAGTTVEDMKHSAHCDMCPPGTKIDGRRYVCRVCADMDLCESCMNSYMKDWCMIACRDHQFMAIPEIQDKTDRTKDVDDGSTVVQESQQEWLKRMRQKYIAKEVSTTTAYRT